MTGNGRSTTKDGLIVAALGSGHTHAEVAQIAHCSERTVRRRAAEPEVSQAVERFRADLVATAAARALDSLEAAVRTMVGLLESESETVRLRAAVAMIDKTAALRELDNTERRLVAIEEHQRSDGLRDGWWVAS